MTMTREHRELIAWRGSVALAKEVYLASVGFPAEDNAVLSTEIRRAAIAIPATIAEGAARASKKEFLLSLDLATGQLAALQAHVAIARELRYLGEDEKLSALIEDVGKLVGGLVTSLRHAPATGD